MNKSTPISQLPSVMQAQNTFVNDQQKQMITNAQQAIQNINLPQNTQIQQDIINDDDVTIQEVLNHINSSQQQQQQPMHPPATQQHPNANTYMQQEIPDQQMMIQNLMNQGMMNQGMINQNLMNQGMMQQPSLSHHGGMSNIDMFFHMFADDIKIALLVLTLFMLTNFIPVGSILGRYIAVDKIPYHDIILKGLLCAVLFILTKKFVLK
jgi:hypothetical protein